MRSGARGDRVLTSPHTMKLTPELCTKENGSPDLKDSKLTKTFAFILMDDSNTERRKKDRSVAHSHVKNKPVNQARAAKPESRAIEKVCRNGLWEMKLTEIAWKNCGPLMPHPPDLRR